MSYVIVTISYMDGREVGRVDEVGLEAVDPNQLRGNQRCWFDDSVAPVKVGDLVVRGSMGLRHVMRPQ